MKYAAGIPRLQLMLTTVLVALAGTTAFAQNPTRASSAPQIDDEVIRINSDLVQTDVGVFDRDGHFVEGLRPEQFVLKVNGQLRPIPFFERVTAGSRFDSAAGSRGE